MSDVRDAQYVKKELLDLASAATEEGLAVFAGFKVVDGELIAETYTDDGQVEAEWLVQVTVVPRAEERADG